MLAPSLAKFGALGVKEYEALDLPYIFPSYDALHKVTGGEVGALLFARLEDKGIKGLAYWDNGFKIMSANQALIHPRTIAGLKMRHPGLQGLGSGDGGAGRAAAGDGVLRRLPGAAIRPGRRRREHAVQPVHPGMHEVQSHLTVTNHGYLGYAVIVNKAFWDQLPDDIRDQLEEAMQQATDFENRIAAKENEDALAKIRAAGTTEIHEPTEEERSEMIARAAAGSQADGRADRPGHDRRDLSGDGFQLTQ
jgi:C4-dicarboxylate-binding protein DctP